jgi:hypothetical protein
MANCGLGEIKFVFVNQTDVDYKLSSQGEYYITAPSTPGTNRQIDAGVISLSNNTTLLVPPRSEVKAIAKFINEGKLRQYLNDGDFFVQIIFSASPRPSHDEFNFNRETFCRDV